MTSVVDAHSRLQYRNLMPLKPIATHKFAVLFVFLLGCLIYFPFAGEHGVPFSVFRVLIAVVILASVYAVSLRHGILLLALALAIPAMVEHTQLLRDYTGVLPLLNFALSFAFDVFIVVVMFRRVFTTGKPDAETIFGALCIYLLIGFSFASLYGLVSRVQPGSFYMNPLLNVRSTPNRFDFVYYSFATMTCLGATGIAPITDHARSVSIIEALVGLLYLAVLISRLMSAYQAYHRLP
jgi:Ion channel